MTLYQRGARTHLLCRHPVLLSSLQVRVSGVTDCQSVVHAMITLDDAGVPTETPAKQKPPAPFQPSGVCVCGVIDCHACYSCNDHHLVASDAATTDVQPPTADRPGEKLVPSQASGVCVGVIDCHGCYSCNDHLR